MVFPYGGLAYFPPVSSNVGHFMLFLLGFSSVTISLGLFTRLSFVVNFVLFTYLFHICESNHNNHYILFCHIAFASIFVDFGKTHSLDEELNTGRLWNIFRRKSSQQHPQHPQAPSSPAQPHMPTVPYWQLLLMQLLFCLPYLYGAIAKLNYDWMCRAEPPKTWFSRREVPTLMHGFAMPYSYWWFPWFIAWSGTAFDFGVRRTFMKFHFRIC
jgi:hypothetical protein